LAAACSGAAVTTATTTSPAPSSSSSRVVWPDEGPRTWAPRQTEAAITANDLRTRLYQLADDSMQGRRIGEPGNYRGTDYIAREFQRLGLKPAGDNGTYFQNLDYGPIGFDSASSRLIVSGSALAGRRDWIPVTPTAMNGIGPRASWSDVPTVFAGRWRDTTVTLDPAIFRGKVAVFVSTPAAAGLGGGGGGGGGGRAGLALRCDSVPTNSVLPPPRASRQPPGPTVRAAVEVEGAVAGAAEAMLAAERATTGRRWPVPWAC